MDGRNLLVPNRAWAISIGTARSALDMRRRSIVGKLKARPYLLKRAIEKSGCCGWEITVATSAAIL